MIIGEKIRYCGNLIKLEVYWLTWHSIRNRVGALRVLWGRCEVFISSFIRGFADDSQSSSRKSTAGV